MKSATVALAQSDLFQTRSELLTRAARVDLAYDRAKAIADTIGLSFNDILNLTPKFWETHLDPIFASDAAATTLLTIQYNLVAGTLAKFAASDRPELIPLVQDIIAYRKIGQFCLTELGRGLDIYRMKTIATLLPSGEFDLHTPTLNDAKFMPPTVPIKGIPCIAVVFAKLVVDGEDRGPRPFLVPLNDGYSMCKGVTSRLLPPRGGSTPVNHALTSFTHVRLPPSALLGQLAKPESTHAEFMSQIWRVAVGTLSLSSPTIIALQVASFVAGKYFQRRHVTGPMGSPMPIIAFRTQQQPLFTAIAQSYALRAMYRWAMPIFTDQTIDVRARHGVATCCKAVMVQHAQAANIALSERLGAQGLFEYNRISLNWNEIRGMTIAEGDVLGLSMHLVTDLLMQKYSMPEPADPSSLLAQHESALFEDALNACTSAPDFIQGYMSHVQPNAQRMTEAMGCRMAYEAARAQGVPACLADLYLVAALKLDAAWYAEKGVLARATLDDMERSALDAAMPRLNEFLDDMGVEPYVTSPVVSDDAWSSFAHSLPAYTHRPVQESFELERARL
ncbi:acyl-CoA dehydrogenase NM domain-like protein [Coniophora puteana RWD-64-598 SS2]|uniref:Acyl-CoA dehydrogenase NM domain-like protein n=1 Tax=Coniophora puteana (strain RWD-64-598) TaxID=741705 RepID=A0A5M3MKB9_CONPW|nr:acyl-CoA dehydrogenase NM domain-like protein [Coniophora puteana RWD-64-598 SS2]EIW79678.1 acyl-CoA dehydrogenase NM domain-like protein [Coniophora puteana RWD-64-598 SS2]